MYAVIQTGGKQYRVEEGDTLRVERLPGAEEGESLTFEEVLFIGGDAVQVGTPHVSGAKVEATLLREDLGPKVVVFKMKRRKGHRRLRGHRQPFAEVRIDKIVAPRGGGKAKKASKPESAAETATDTVKEEE